MASQLKPGFAILALATFGWTSFCLGQSLPQTPAPDSKQVGPVSAGEQPPGQLPGSISGTIVDQSGAVVAGARVRLTGEDQFLGPEVVTGDDGRFSFANVTPGPFRLAISSAGFTPQKFSGVLHSGESETLPQIAMNVADALTEVQVGLSRVEVAEEQIKVEEQQRVLGVIPNFYVSYNPNAVALTPKQKFKLAFRTVVDPFTFVVVGGTAGVEQWQNHFSEYGQGAQGYGKRFGAGYADTVSGTFIGGAILPSLLKQDPRYFYKGTGSKASRFLYALANSVICKGDNGRWQPNYSNILGSLAAGGISNLYYPAQDRNGLGLTLESGAIGVGTTAISNLFQEFIIRRLTPSVPNTPAKP